MHHICIIFISLVLLCIARRRGDKRSSKVSFFFQAEDDIRLLVRSRGLGGVYKSQGLRPSRASGRARLTMTDIE